MAKPGKHMNKLAKTTQFNRGGNVYYRVDQREDGQSLVSLSVDFEKVPVPENSYISDYFEVRRADGDVVMVFGKKDFPSESQLRNKIEIYFPIHPFVHQFWKSARKMHELLRTTFEKKGRTANVSGGIQNSGEKVQTLAANNALIVMSGGQCVMDFFLIAAKDLWLKTKKGDPLNVDAIVRVFVSENILLGLLNRCDELAEELKPELDYPVTEEDDEVVESLAH
jgi:hypothetical protein